MWSSVDPFKVSMTASVKGMSGFSRASTTTWLASRVSAWVTFG